MWSSEQTDIMLPSDWLVLSFWQRVQVYSSHLIITEVLIDEEELFPDDALSTHTDMVDNEPAVNEARRQFMR